MANEFRNRTLTGVGTSATSLYATPDGKTSIVLELDIANITSAVVEASVELLDYSVHPTTGWRYIVKNAPVPAGGSLMVIAGQKIVLKPLDSVRVTSSAASTMDVVAAILEDVN